MAELIEMPFGLRIRMGLSTYYIGVQVPHDKGQFSGGKGRPIGSTD